MIRRVLWTVGLGLGGSLLGGKGGGWWGAVIGTIWGGSIGFGFGSIFNEKNATKLLLVYWTITLALVGVFFGLLVGAGLQPDDSTFKEAIHGVIGLIVGAMLGTLVGTKQLGRMRRQSQDGR
jgi:hypothetical protein